MRYLIFLILFSILLIHKPLLSQNPEIISLIESGNQFYKIRLIDSALYYYNLAVEKDSTSAEAYFRRALARSKNNDNEGARADYKNAIRINPKPVYYNNMGIILTLEECHEEALLEYDKALAIDSNYVQAIFNKGISYHHMGMQEEACKFIGKAKERGFQPAEQYYQQYCP